MSKFSALFIVAILLCFSLKSAARPDSTLMKAQFKDARDDKVENDEGICEGVEEEDCLKRRTMEAHIDYIYTQSQGHP
ncbi:PREDICTED: phytosulfokines 3-like [Nicotiana attenuata]|uniref:phytosulfokines 3-like n=1 Tax=Nicotiana attenuata TaxID=49451 RepID=UPI000905169E|nr:PREDICTED: phytosulfokines 3-like [Nicotiana attenuata]